MKTNLNTHTLFFAFVCILTFSLVSFNKKAFINKNLKIISYNVLYGFNHGKSEKEAIEWIKKEIPDVIAFQELKGYTTLKMKELANKWGHQYSYLWDRPGSVQPIAITSNQPITNIKKVKKTKADRGFLIAKTHDITYIIVHLHPNNVKRRLAETAVILASVDSLKKLNEDIAILGDFNAMSPMDSIYVKKNIQERLKKRIQLEKCADLVGNCTNWDYSVIQQYLNADLIDVSFTKLENKVQLLKSSLFGTFPSTASVNIPDLKTRSQNLHRLDFVFMNPELAKRVTNSKIAQEPIQELISDHYPVIVSLDLNR